MPLLPYPLPSSTFSPRYFPTPLIKMFFFSSTAHSSSFSCLSAFVSSMRLSLISLVLYFVDMSFHFQVFQAQRRKDHNDVCNYYETKIWYIAGWWVTEIKLYLISNIWLYDKIHIANEQMPCYYDFFLDNECKHWFSISVSYGDLYCKLCIWHLKCVIFGEYFMCMIGLLQLPGSVVQCAGLMPCWPTSDDEAQWQ